MDAMNATNTPFTKEHAAHALVLQWLLNPQSSNLTRAEIHAIDWDALAHYYLQDENDERLQVFVDYLCHNDYQQLRNHTLIPLLHHRLLPMICMIMNAAYQPVMTSKQDAESIKTPGYYKKQRLLILLQLLTTQGLLMKSYFNNTPKALVNLHKTMQRLERESTNLSVFTSIMPILFDLTLGVYLQLPKKPAYRFATLELRTLLLSWFRYISLIVSDSPDLTFNNMPFVRYFKTLPKRQQLLELIENRQLHAFVPTNHEDLTNHSMSHPEADQPCISRASHGLMRAWA